MSDGSNSSSSSLILIAVCLICSLLAIGADKLDRYSRSPDGIYHGRYTRDIREAELLIPWLVYENGAFHTYELTKFYDRQQEINGREKRSVDARLHLILPFADSDHHVELEPYHDFISPHMVIERRSIDGDSSHLDEDGLSFQWPSARQCHYRGTLRGLQGSRAVLSLCDGVTGYVHTNDGRYFIEPLYEDTPETDGQHIHVAYKKEAPYESNSQSKYPYCGTNDDWESAWTEQLKRLRASKTTSDLTSIDESRVGNRKTASSSTHSVHRYIEVALVADRRFLDFHNGTNYEQYLLTVMNMVSDFYHDASVGNQIDIVVVRMIYLEQQGKEADLHISSDGEKTLDSFSKWIEKLNPSDPEHPNHFDIGALVTRYDLCAERNNCNLLGLAYVAAACERKKAACINEDPGLLLGIVIAHEIGHTLGCSHDTEEISGCPPKDKDQSYFVMSPIVFIYTIRWSACSKKFITSFLESGLGECLNNNPKNPPDKYKFPNMLPGAMYDAAFQCNLDYPGSTPCDLDNEDCETLWCHLGGDSCKSKGAPPADGTKCGKNKWCIHKKCVEMGARSDAVNGGWGAWGKLGGCSRTCGGGIQFAERECNKPVPKNGGRYCTGERKKFATCNTKPCNAINPSFRAIQCAEYNKKDVFPGGPYKWEPFLRSDLDSCALYCVNQAHTFLKLSPTAKDGTQCKEGTYNMCISGVCRKVGCDWIIDSDAVEDICDVCKGGGTSCTKIEGDYTEVDYGYTKVVIVPKGSKHIRVYERNEHENTLAVKLANKVNAYCLNGNFKEQRSGNYPCAGATIVYKHITVNLEEIEIRGPIKEDIEIQYVFYKLNNPGLHYIYYINTPDESYTPKYSWEFIEWSDCDAKCGGGTKISEGTCIEARAGRVDSKFCKGIQKPPPKSQICNQEPCAARWRVSQWSRCSGCDGKSGKIRRKIQCARPGPRSDEDYIQANFDACPGKPPIQTRKCVGNQPCRKPCLPKNAAAMAPSRFLSVEDRRGMIDELVDYGLARYLEKTRGVVASSRALIPGRGSWEEDENLVRLLRDWIGEEENAEQEKRAIRNSHSYSNHRIFTTPIPGSIVIDTIPVTETIEREKPQRRGPKKRPNKSHQIDEEVVSEALTDTQRENLYRRWDDDEAIERFDGIESRSSDASMEQLDRIQRSSYDAARRVRHRWNSAALAE